MLDAVAKKIVELDNDVVIVNAGTLWRIFHG